MKGDVVSACLLSCSHASITQEKVCDIIMRVLNTIFDICHHSRLYRLASLTGT